MLTHQHHNRGPKTLSVPLLEKMLGGLGEHRMVRFHEFLVRGRVVACVSSNYDEEADAN